MSAYGLLANFVRKPLLLTVVSLVAACGGGGGGGGGGNESSAPPPPPLPTVSLSPDQPTVQPGGTVTLSWTSNNATECEFPGVPQSLAPSDTLTIGPVQIAAGQISYSMTCTGAGGTASGSATVTVPHVLTSITVVPDAYLMIADGISSPTLTTIFYDQTGIQFSDASIPLELYVDGALQPTLDFTSVLSGAYSFQIRADLVESSAFDIFARESKDYPIVEVPIVFHLIHWGEPIGIGDNFPQSEVQAAITALNAAFANQLGSADPNAVDLKLRFRAAAFGPNGAPLVEPGIDRIDGRPYDDGSDNPFGNPSGSIAGNNILEIWEAWVIKRDKFWDPREYVEVWVVPSSQNTFGRTNTYGNADLPLLLQSTPYPGLQNFLTIYPDPMVTRNPPGFWLGALRPHFMLFHEMGHHFGLLHPFSEGQCDAGDFAPDTYGYVLGTTTECETNGVRNNNNTMDYNGANNTFTYDQRERVQWVLGNAVWIRDLPSSTK